MCDPILVTLLKMQPHYSQSSRENATPSSGTSPVASYKEVPLPGFFPSHAMEKALGTRLIVCCLEVLPLRPFTFSVYCRMRSLILGLSFGQSEKKKEKKWRSLKLGGLAPQHDNMRSLEMTRRG